MSQPSKERSSRKASNGPTGTVQAALREIVKLCAKEGVSRESLKGNSVLAVESIESGDVGVALVVFDATIGRRLTKRERQVACKTGHGRGNKGIGAELGLTEATIKGHLHDIFNKTTLRTRASLARYALVAFLDRES